jgi:hypothetical protein
MIAPSPGMTNLATPSKPLKRLLSRHGGCDHVAHATPFGPGFREVDCKPHGIPAKLRYTWFMKARRRLHNHVVAALLPFFLAWRDRRGSSPAETAPDAQGPSTRCSSEAAGRRECRAAGIEREIWNEWSKSGSPAMDLLLQRGRDAMEAGDMTAAIEHLTALVDHAPTLPKAGTPGPRPISRRAVGPSVADIADHAAAEPAPFRGAVGAWHDP